MFKIFVDSRFIAFPAGKMEVGYFFGCNISITFTELLFIEK
jgi:hypothetical protein